jgi:hypothetical protein
VLLQRVDNQFDATPIEDLLRRLEIRCHVRGLHEDTQGPKDLLHGGAARGVPLHEVHNDRNHPCIQSWINAGYPREYRAPVLCNLRPVAVAPERSQYAFDPAGATEFTRDLFHPLRQRSNGMQTSLLQADNILARLDDLEDDR